MHNRSSVSFIVFFLLFLPIFPIHVTVDVAKPLACLIVLLRLDVDKGQVLWSGILDTPSSLRVLLLRNSLTYKVHSFIRRCVLYIKLTSLIP